MMKPDVVKEAYAEVANMETDNGKLRLGFTFSPETMAYFTDYDVWKPEGKSKKRSRNLLSLLDFKECACLWADVYTKNLVVQEWMVDFGMQEFRVTKEDSDVVANSLVSFPDQPTPTGIFSRNFFVQQLDHISKKFKGKLRNREQASVCRTKKLRKVKEASTAKKDSEARRSASTVLLELMLAQEKREANLLVVAQWKKVQELLSPF